MPTPRDTPSLFLVRVGMEVGRPPAVLVSECRGCARALAAYLTLQGISARTGDARGAEVYITEDAGACAEALLRAFRAWRAVAVAPGTDDHLQALTVGATL